MKLRAFGHRLIRPFARFLRQEDGSIIVEGTLLLPMLLWATFGLYVYWDAYKTHNTLQKATYSVADAYSRLQANATVPFANGIEDMMNYVIPRDENARLRVTSVIWSQARNRYEVTWSCSLDRVTMPALTTGDLANYAGKLPVVADAMTLLLVESRYDFTPVMDMGLDPLTFRVFVATPPRWAEIGFNSPQNCGL